MPDCENCNLDDRVSKLEDSYTELHEKVAVNEQKFICALESLKGLPEALQGLKDSTVEMKHELNQNTMKVNALSDRVEKIDEKGKFDIMNFTKSNWPWITMVLLLGMAYAQNFIVIP